MDQNDRDNDDIRAWFASRLNQRKLSLASLGIGFCAVIYSTFIYDTTISPMDAPSSYSSVDASSSYEDRASAIAEVNDRFDRLRAGVRYSSAERLETKQQIFFVGIFLMLVGGVVLWRINSRPER